MVNPPYLVGREISTISLSLHMTEAATRGVLLKKVFLEISQNSQENTCARVSFLIKLQAAATASYMRHPVTAGINLFLLLFLEAAVSVECLEWFSETSLVCF